MARARLAPAARPTSGIPASKITKMAEMRSRARQPARPAAPSAAATAKESSPSGSTNASSLATGLRSHAFLAEEPLDQGAMPLLPLVERLPLLLLLPGACIVEDLLTTRARYHHDAFLVRHHDVASVDADAAAPDAAIERRH